MPFSRGQISGLALKAQQPLNCDLSDTSLGANLRRERMRQEMTQERLAEFVEVNIRTVRKIEVGDTNILVTTLIGFQQALKCGWNKLLPSD